MSGRRWKWVLGGVWVLVGACLPGVFLEESSGTIVLGGTLCDNDELVARGDIRIRSETDLAEMRNCTAVEGDLHVEAPLADFGPLASLRTVSGLINLNLAAVTTLELPRLTSAGDVILSGGNSSTLRVIRLPVLEEIRLGLHISTQSAPLEALDLGALVSVGAAATSEDCTRSTTNCTVDIALSPALSALDLSALRFADLRIQFSATTALPALELPALERGGLRVIANNRNEFDLNTDASRRTSGLGRIGAPRFASGFVFVVGFAGLTGVELAPEHVGEAIAFVDLPDLASLRVNARGQIQSVSPSGAAGLGTKIIGLPALTALELTTVEGDAYVEIRGAPQLEIVALTVTGANAYLGVFDSGVTTVTVRGDPDAALALGLRLEQLPSLTSASLDAGTLSLSLLRLLDVPTLTTLALPSRTTLSAATFPAPGAAVDAPALDSCALADALRAACGGDDAQVATLRCDGQPIEFCPHCGDFVRAADEECDDGNHVSRDGCSAACNLPSRRMRACR